VLVGNSKRNEETALMVLEESVKTSIGESINRYHLCSNWLFDYWKSRAYLTACVASAWRNRIYVLGREVPIEVIRRYREGLHLLEHRDGSSLPTAGLHWYPEDMAVKPASFLGGLSEDTHGRIHGLELWLQLDQEGHMKVDLPYANVRKLFADALKGEMSQSGIKTPDR
jgi:hypothetical protein